MSTAIHDTDRRIIDRYTDQPAGLPAELRNAVRIGMAAVVISSVGAVIAIGLVFMRHLGDG